MYTGGQEWTKLFILIMDRVNSREQGARSKKAQVRHGERQEAGGMKREAALQSQAKSDHLPLKYLRHLWIKSG
jgi:hypothetical protein